ncbi:unnamed protein product [Discosporangium mesarthrocarpum]
MIPNLWGPVAGRRHNGYLCLKASSTHDFVTLSSVSRCFAYRDTAYAVMSHVKRGTRHHNQHDLTEEQQTRNRALSKARVSVKWLFGKIYQMWQFLDHRQKLQLRKMPIDRMFQVENLITFTIALGKVRQGFFWRGCPTVEKYFALYNHTVQEEDV